MATCIPHLHVANILDTIQWYKKVGFDCIGTHHEEGCELDWAMLENDGARFMLYPEGSISQNRRMDAGLYFEFESIEGMEAVIKDHAEIIEINSQTEYGMQEIVFKDLNGFQITFACSVSGKKLINGIRGQK